ncbi:MAG TPA: hypothetical protein DCZ92_01440 [Elusimicrobia bacterium]|nr:hypothetical protein [Elusimicrobiota bacterium]
MTRLLLAYILTLPAVAGAATIAGRDLAGQNLICGPGSTADNSIPCSPNDVLSGVFTNVGLFQINAGTTVFVTPAIPLIIFASTISIPGTLNGSGRGEVGGIGGDPGQPGGDGAGRGPGIGADANKGGGGGAYGGAGGNGAGTDGVLGIGGAAYDDIALPVSPGYISLGSGGGGGGGTSPETGGSGGQGGASIYLEASSFTLTGFIFPRGVPGGNATKPADAGGGGAGGGLLLRCTGSATVNGVINASGGKGGDATGSGGNPGGGGGGGRVKIYYRQAAFSVAISTAGGPAGVQLGAGSSGLPLAVPGSPGTVSFNTVASPPAGLIAPTVFATSITWSWTAAPDWGNAAEASRKYRLYSGTVSYLTPDRSPQLAVSSATLSATETSLTPNTAYTRYVTAFTDYSDSLPSNPVSTYTLAGLPGAAASTFTAVAAYSLGLNWSAGEPANPGYTIYEVNRSTDIDFGVDVSTSYITALSSAPAGLAPNTTYYFRVRAINLANLPTEFNGVLSTATLAVEPADPSLAGVGPSGFNFSWNGGGNPPQTRYIAEISTDNFATLSRSSSTFNTGAAFTGLAVNTLYYARVKAQNHNGLDTAYTAAVTTVTAAAPPLNAPVPFTNLSYDSLTFNWESGGNSAGTSYNAEISTNGGFSAPVSSAVTTNLNYDFTGLSVNTTYYARVRALGAGGLASLYSSPAVSTVTLTLSPVAAAPPFTGVFAGSFTFSWETGGNPGGTLYIAEISRDGFVSVSSAVLTSALSVDFSALEANTIYQARVRAVSFSGIPGQYSSPIVSTATAISAPVNAAAPFPSLSAAGLTFSWGDGGNAPGTSYNPEISTNSDFSAPVSSDVTTNLNYVFTGLSANTTYYAHVRAVGVGGNLTAHTGAVSTVTYTLAPLVAAAPFTGVSTAGFTLSWSGGGNPPGTLYAAEISRNSFDTLIASASTLSISAVFSGLTPNTVYQARVKAINFLEVDGPYSSPIRSTATLATAPLNSAQPFTAVSASTATFTWADGGNPGGTRYIVELSSAGFAPGTAISSAATLALSQTFGGLLPNTTYYGRAKAVNADDIPSGYSTAVAAVTLPLAPALAVPPFNGVTSSSITFSWTANGNPQNTVYVAELSGNGFVSVSSAVQTTSLSAAFSSLAANTVYQARVRAVNFAGIPGDYSSPIVSTATASSLPVNAAVPFLNLSANGLTFNWESGGNSAGTSYNPEISTSSSFSAPVSSEVTTNLNYVFTGLSVNATYYARVRAIGVGGDPTAYTGAVSTVTYTLAPALAVPPFNGVTSSGITFSWTANGNPQNTVYVAELSGNGFVSVSSAVQTTSLSAAFSSLAANTVYQARVRAVNFAGIPGDYSSPIVSTATASSLPVNAAVPFLNLSANGLTFNWESGGNSAGTSYNPEISTNSDFSAPVSSDVTVNLNYVFTGLSVNATYYARVRALGVGGLASPYSSPVVSTVTLTLSPVTADPPFTGVFAGSFTFSWENGGNPGGTLYTAEISKDGFVSVSSAALTSALGAVFSALTANTVYQARVRAVNFAGIPGQFSSPIVSTATAGSAPVNVAAPFLNLSAGGLTFAWGDGGNAAGTGYNLEVSTNSSFSAPVSSDVTTNLSYVLTGLSANTTYYAHVRAVGAGGNYTAYTGAVSTVTYTLPPAVSAAPFITISTNSFTFTWSDGGNPLNTRYAAELSRNNFDTLIASASTLSNSTVFSALTPNTVHQARVKAINFLGLDGPYSSPVRSTTTLVTDPLNAAQPFTAVSASTLTFTWASGGNPGGTSYTVELSSAGFAPGTAISSASTLALSQTFGGLLPNTTYYGRARAVNMDNVPGGYSPAVAAVTLPLPPALAAAPFSGVTSSGLAFNWTANGNPQNTTYLAEISKDNFVSVSLSSTTLNIPAAFTGLTPNTTYTARVRAINFSGSAGPYADTFVSTATLAVPPQSVVSSFTLTDNGLTVRWSAGDNPSGTMYETEVSTRSDFAVLWASAAAAGVSGNFALAANTTYYARVRARNHNGRPTADLELGGELTYAAAPAVSASTTTGPVSVTTFSFVNTVSTGTGGLVFYRTVWDRDATHAWNDQEPGWTALAVLTTTATGNGFWFLHLRSYNFNALGYKTADIGPFHVALSTVMPPGQPVPVPGAFTATSGITWNWPPALAFGDTTISTYVVSVGTTPADFNVLVDSEIGPLASFTLDPAANGKTYYLKVKAIDEGGIFSQHSAVSSPGVLVDRTAPARLVAVQSDREFSYDSAALFSWSASADQESGIKAYLLDLGTTVNGNDIFNAKNMGLALSSLETGLPSGKTVFARVRAENNAGGVSDYSDPGPGIPVWSLSQEPPMVQPYNWPNPFDPLAGPTQIGFYLKAPAKVTLKLFTLEGNLVYEETRGEGSAGNKVWPWAGRSGTGKITAPGGYVCIIEKKYAGKTERQQFKLAVLY